MYFIRYPNTSSFVKIQLSSWCLDIPMKHCLSCLIFYFYDQGEDTESIPGIFQNGKALKIKLLRHMVGMI